MGGKLPLSRQSVKALTLPFLSRFIAHRRLFVGSISNRAVRRQSLINNLEIEPVQLQPGQALNENQKFTIMVVDDELINVQVLVNYLSMQNYAVVQAFDGFRGAGGLGRNKSGI